LSQDQIYKWRWDQKYKEKKAKEEIIQKYQEIIEKAEELP